MITGDLHFGMPWEAYRLSVIVPAMARKLVQEQGDSDSPPLKVYVNKGRWAIKCECNSAEYSFEDGIFMCQSCFNTRHKHQYRRYVFPRSRKRIEAILLERPLDNRNWWPHETVTQLEADNNKHAAELLGGA